jgi:KipI family sensor histidine kinase inhibitor
MTALPMAETRPRVVPLGDTAFTLTVREPPGPGLSARLRALGTRLEKLPGVLDTVQSFQTLTVFHTGEADRAALEAAALAGAGEGGDVAGGEGRRWEVPGLFDAAHGPDQESAAEALGLTPAALVEAVCAEDWPVLAVGFLAGYPFLGPLPPALKLPRRKNPRMRVPAGSIAIANGFCGIYPWVSPGGWHILGHTEFRLFDPHAEPAARLAPGDRVRFVPVAS